MDACGSTARRAPHGIHYERRAANHRPGTTHRYHLRAATEFCVVSGRGRIKIRGASNCDRHHLGFEAAVGNRVLGAMLSSGLSRIAFTTNFDSIVEKAVAEVSGNSLSAYPIEGSRSAVQALDNEEFPFYCKLHGDFRYDSVKNLAADLAAMPSSLRRSK